MAERVTREELAEALRGLESALEAMRNGADKALYSHHVNANRSIARDILSRLDAEQSTEPSQELKELERRVTTQENITNLLLRIDVIPSPRDEPNGDGQ
jgi:hypothetical protein